MLQFRKVRLHLYSSECKKNISLIKIKEELSMAKSKHGSEAKNERIISESNRLNTAVLKDPAASECDKVSAYTQLYNDNLGLVDKIVNEFRIPEHISRYDIMVAGKTGLKDAIEKVEEKFNPEKGKFSTFSASYIRKPIYIALRDLGQLIIIKEGSSTNKIQHMVRQLAELHQCEPYSLSLKEITEAVRTCYPSIKKSTIKAVVLLPTQKTDFVDTDEEDSHKASASYENHVPYYEDYESEADSALRTGLLHDAYNYALTDVERNIFSALNGYKDDGSKHLRLSEDKKTVKELSVEYGISYEAMRQKESRILAKLSSYCRERYNG